MTTGKTELAPNGLQGDRKPLHLLIVSNTDLTTHISGGDRDWVNLLNALGGDRVRITWLGQRGTELLGPSLAPEIQARFLNIPRPSFYTLFHEEMYRPHSFRMWLGIIKRQVVGLRPGLKSLRRSLREDPPDVVVSSTSVELMGAVYAWTARLPHVWCVKEFLDPSVADSRRFAWLIEKFSHEVIVPSKAMAGAFSERVHVLNDGSNLEAIRGATGGLTRDDVLNSLDLPTTQPLIAQVGGVCWAKGQHVTAEACAQLASEGLNASILFLGACPDDQKEKLRNILSNAPESTQASVRFVQFSSGDFSYLSAADIMVHPSVLPDPYPNAVREALILGKAVIGSKVGGIPELIQNEETGLLVEAGNARQLAGALRRLIVSPEERARLGGGARQFADAKLDINLCKNAFFKLVLALPKKR